MDWPITPVPIHPKRVVDGEMGSGAAEAAAEAMVRRRRMVVSIELGKRR